MIPDTSYSSSPSLGLAISTELYLFDLAGYRVVKGKMASGVSRDIKFTLALLTLLGNNYALMLDRIVL